MVRATKSLLGEKSANSHPRDFPIFSPRTNEWPPSWLASEKLPTVDLDNIRVAKNGEEVIGAYEVERLESTVFLIKWVIVEPNYRRRGLGSWLLAHAIGIIESKGGRIVVVYQKSSPFFLRLDFVEVSECKLQLVLTPE